jgi:hypothetical protein
MFIREKKTEGRVYLQIVENHREGQRTVQRVIATLGRLDRLLAETSLDPLAKSIAKYSKKVQVVEGLRSGRLEAGAMRCVGPDLIFGRLWKELGLTEIVNGLQEGRRFGFAAERAVYMSVLHRLFESGSDRAALKWRRDTFIPAGDELSLNHLYRAMRFLGESKDQVEQKLFARNRTLFTDLSLAFFDTTSIYFEGEGGETVGQYGHSKDHRPDLKQLVMGVVLTGEGRPICCEIWPGDTTDVKTLLGVVDRIRKRFSIKSVCWVADRGMVSADVIRGLEKRNLQFILGARMRRQKEVSEEVLSRRGRYREVTDNLQVKEVLVEDRRYVVCFNPDEAEKDRRDREAIVESLQGKLGKGASGLIGNKGYQRYLKVARGSFTVDAKKVKDEARFDGKFVLRTNTKLPTTEVALQYKRLLLVERFFRDIKSLVETRPIFHQWDSTITGHVFCSFLALVLLDELKRRLDRKGWSFEWDDICRDLNALTEVDVRDGNEWYVLRPTLKGCAGKLLLALGMAVPPGVRLKSVDTGPSSAVVPRP